MSDFAKERMAKHGAVYKDDYFNRGYYITDGSLFYLYSDGELRHGVNDSVRHSAFWKTEDGAKQFLARWSQLIVSEDDLKQKLAQVERERDSAKARLEEALELLSIAQCPECDGSGGIPHQVGDQEWELEQCRFCYERDGLLANQRTDKE